MGERLHTAICHVDEVPTRDGVSVNVSVAVSGQEHDTQQAGSLVASYAQAIDHLARAPLRRKVGSSTLGEFLCDRAAMKHALCKEVGLRAGERGLTVHAVAVRDVAPPPAIRVKADALVLLALHRCRVRRRL